ncbi:uncharacterized protein HKW66_Vig0132920 [Vigna angularis]|uniref:Bifunctional inhibitor/plant lipid transfer protein/seed storage helical domain-containing protein n=2 Tax=Phaseolus angularis TaxID=3914 RepID=A0A8T0K1K6_PHAAN|nr:uncharacterized protein HKW66_Vig0132920 [Vigna angularis]BAT80827.1 hypothetical protein VIGAN_03043800 [Vigna angularis var. angularis]
MKKMVFVSFFTILFVLVIATEPSNGLTCEQEKSLLMPCLDFVTKKTVEPSSLCCKGLNQIISLPLEEMLSAGTCLKEAVSHIPNLDKDRIINLPEACKLNLHSHLQRL